MSRKSNKNAHLLVEGKNDWHVIEALCKSHQLPETFDILIPGEEGGGVESLLRDIPARLSESGLKALGIVLDADEDIQARWDGVRGRLEEAGYTTPKQPVVEGFVAALPDYPKVGVWVMPNNQLPGMLEDFVRYLIPPDDHLKPVAEEALQSIEQKGLNRYRPAHRSKAFIHTWLAWQETPGWPMGQAITARVLQYDQYLANCFATWLRKVFE